MPWFTFLSPDLLLFYTNPSRPSADPTWAAFAGLLHSSLSFCLSLWTIVQCWTPPMKVLPKIFAGCCEMKVGVISQSRDYSGSRWKQTAWVHFSPEESNLLLMKAKLTTGRTEFYASCLIPLQLYWAGSWEHTSSPPSSGRNMTQRDMINESHQLEKSSIRQEKKTILSGSRKVEDKHCVS